MIDEYPVLAIAATVAKGTTRMEGLEELRVKESDRLAAMEEGLRANHVVVRSGKDWLEVDGSQGQIQGGGIVDTKLDHRIAMSFMVLGLVTERPVQIDDGQMIQTSFPGFEQLMNSLGAQINAA
jgi:3-phosphoshikimate 1-carboxyvinyltransferase